jgi:hypothetical protein
MISPRGEGGAVGIVRTIAIQGIVDRSWKAGKLRQQLSIHHSKARPLHLSVGSKNSQRIEPGLSNSSEVHVSQLRAVLDQNVAHRFVSQDRFEVFLFKAVDHADP